MVDCNVQQWLLVIFYNKKTRRNIAHNYNHRANMSYVCDIAAVPNDHPTMPCHQELHKYCSIDWAIEYYHHITEVAINDNKGTLFLPRIQAWNSKNRIAPPFNIWQLTIASFICKE
jgi:hypothetical protein